MVNGTKLLSIISDLKVLVGGKQGVPDTDVGDIAGVNRSKVGTKTWTISVKIILHIIRISQIISLSLSPKIISL